eukprot:6709068-Prymnesium_polylepis.1
MELPSCSSPPPAPPTPPPPQPSIPRGFERVCECSDATPLIAYDGERMYCAPPLSLESAAADEAAHNLSGLPYRYDPYRTNQREYFSNTCKRGLPRRMSCAKCDVIPSGFRDILGYIVDDVKSSVDFSRLSTIDDFDDGQIHNPQRIPKYWGRPTSQAVADVDAAGACTIPEDDGWTSTYNPHPYGAESDCDECLSRLPGGDGRGSPWSRFSYCFGEPDPAHFPRSFTRQVTRQGGDGVCADGASRAFQPHFGYSWRDRITQEWSVGVDAMGMDGGI